MPRKAATKPVPTAPTKTKTVHMDASQRVTATKKGHPDRLIVQTTCGRGRGANMSTKRDEVTCPECVALLPPVEPPPVASPAPTSVPKRYVGKPAKPCKDCGTTIYGKTVERCVPCWKAYQAAKAST